MGQKHNIGIKKHVSVVDIGENNIAVEIICNFECEKERYLRAWDMIDEKLWEIEKILLYEDKGDKSSYADEIINICNKLLLFVNDDGLTIHLEKILELADRIKENREG